MTAVALAGKKNSESLCTSEDTRATFRCLNELHGGGILDCGESGTTLRFLLPVASALGINAEFIGHGRLPERPMSALNNALRENGAVISADNLPIKVSGQLHPGVFRVPGNISSQFISGLLFALPLLDGDSEIVIEGKRESVGYIDMTLDTLRSFSINIEGTPSGYKIKGPQKYIEPDSSRVQGDWSNAAFFLCAGALGGETDITGLSLDSRQSDRAVVSILKDFGADVKCGDIISVRGNGLRGIKIDISQCPDLFPTLAATACAALGDTIFTNAARLRIKESDRIEAVEKMINSLGGFAESTEDSLTVHGTGTLPGGEVDSFNDHRIVMAAAIAACICENPVIIHDAQAVNKSYPNFFEDYRKLGGKADVI
jgi:3-phosphoshikimate 1-carboxyvinyltransferase